MTTSFGVSEIVFFSSANLTTNGSCSANVCNIPGLANSGLKKVKIESVSTSSVRIEVI